MNRAVNTSSDAAGNFHIVAEFLSHFFYGATGNSSDNTNASCDSIQNCEAISLTDSFGNLRSRPASLDSLLRHIRQFAANAAQSGEHCGAFAKLRRYSAPIFVRNVLAELDGFITIKRFDQILAAARI